MDANKKIQPCATFAARVEGRIYSNLSNNLCDPISHSKSVDLFVDYSFKYKKRIGCRVSHLDDWFEANSRILPETGTHVTFHEKGRESEKIPPFSVNSHDIERCESNCDAFICWRWERIFSSLSENQQLLAFPHFSVNFGKIYQLETCLGSLNYNFHISTKEVEVIKLWTDPCCRPSPLVIRITIISLNFLLKGLLKMSFVSMQWKIKRRTPVTEYPLNVKIKLQKQKENINSTSVIERKPIYRWAINWFIQREKECNT